MPAEDRDRLFEKALARQLRAEAGAAGDAACLDAETLAAYHDRLLASDEMMSAKSHIVTCARCQQILAQLEITQEALERESNVIPAGAMPVPLPEAQPTPREVATFPARKTTLLRWAAPAGAIAAGILIWVGVRDYRAQHEAVNSPVQIAENRNEVSPTPEPPAAAPQTRAKEKSSTAPSEERQQEQNLRSSDVLRDAAPAPRDANRPQPSTNADVALSSPADLASPKIMAKAAPGQVSSVTGFQAGAGAGASGAAPAKKNEDLDAGDKIMAYTAQNKPAAQDSSAPLQGAIAGRPAAPLPPPPSPSRTAGSGQLHGIVTDPSGAAIAGVSVALKSEKGSTVASTSTDTTGTYSFDDVAEGNYHLELQNPGFQTDRITGLNVAPGDNVVDAKLQVGASAQTVEVTAQTVTLNAESTRPAAKQKDEKRLAATARNVFALQTLQSAATSPDGKSMWRFGEHGKIAHSSDGGSTWASQAASVTATLTSGSAPSNKVCWIAGAAGTLLRTTDRGKHWQRVTTPIAADLGGVQATDAKHAIIWDGANQMRYETSDGGLNWRPPAKQ
jgi:hypothetical protein